MPRVAGPVGRIAVVLALVILVLASAAGPAGARRPARDRAVSSQPGARTQAQRAMDRSLLGRIDRTTTVAWHAATGRVRAMGGTPRRPAIDAAALGRPRTARAAGAAFLRRFGPLFGVRAPARDLRLARGRLRDRGRTVLRYQQLDQGVPVMGGELVVQVAADGSVISAHGEVSPGVTGRVHATVTAAAARRAALRVVGRASHRATARLTAARPVLRIWDPRLVGGPGAPVAVPAWTVRVASRDRWVDQLVVVDARTGGILARMDQHQRLAPLRICDQHGDPQGGGTYGDRTPCDPGEGVADPGSSVVADVKSAWDALRGTLDFYLDHFDRDGLADDGATVVVTVRYCPSTGVDCPFDNAFYDGSLGQLVLGAGYANDDTVGHELTHGVTDHESELFYWYESGALNEALSDIFGEAIDEETPMGKDGKAHKWKVGEDRTGGPVRDMADPPAHGQPDRMGSDRYFTWGWDNGGVHTNSGVAAKTAYLMQDGGTFNGRTITGLKRAKAIAIWYEVATNLLTSGSDHRDLAVALPQACRTLVGTVPRDDGGTPNPNGAITNADCTQVERAVAATELALEVSGNTPASDALCHDSSPSYLLNETFSGVEDDWTVDDDLPWLVSSAWANSPAYAMVAQESGDPLDGTLTLIAPVRIPSGRPAFLSFRHALLLEPEPNGRAYHASVVEATVTPSGVWNDLDPLWTFNGYNGTADDTGGQPLGLRDTFMGPTRGWALSKANLGVFAGFDIKVRFRYGTRGLNPGQRTWYLDDVRIYTCVDNGDNAAPALAPTLDLRTGSLGATDTPVRVTVRTGATDRSGIAQTDFGYRRGTGAWQDAGQSRIAVTSQGYGVATTGDTQSFRVRAQDEQGNWSGWRSVSGVLRLRQETGGSPAVQYTGAWASSVGTGYSGGAARYASGTGRTASLRVKRATDLAWVATKGPDRGRADVWVDGVRKRTVDLYAAERADRQVVYAISFATPGTHRIEIRPTGTRSAFSSGTRVDIDAFETITAP